MNALDSFSVEPGGACRGGGKERVAIRPVDPGLQDLHDTEQQPDVQEESKEGPASMV